MKITVKNIAIAIGSAYLLFLAVQIPFVNQKDAFTIETERNLQEGYEAMERLGRSIDRINQKSDE